MPDELGALGEMVVAFTALLLCNKYPEKELDPDELVNHLKTVMKEENILFRKILATDIVLLFSIVDAELRNE